MTHIGSSAFANCGSLTDVYFKGNAPSLGYGSLSGMDGVTIRYLSGTMGWGATFGDLLTETWVLPESAAIVAPGITANLFGFTIIGPNNSVVVETTTDLSHPSWTPLATLTLSGGSAYFSDPQ